MLEKAKKFMKTFKQTLADDRRTFARSPRKFAFKDWKAALVATKGAMASKRLGILAAGVAYFSTLAFFPLVAALVAIVSFAISKDELNAAVQVIESYLPSDIAFLVTNQLAAALENPSSSILIIVFGILISLFSVSGAVNNLISATNVSYEVDETRRFVTLRLSSLAFIGLGFVTGVIVLGLLTLNQNVLVSVGISEWLAIAIIIVRWVVIAALVIAAFAIFYRYGPNRPNPHWQWVTWGSAIAALFWLLGTALFFVYARYFAHFSDAYSVFAGIIVLMLWLNLGATALLIGAEINFRLENQTRAKTSK